MIHVSDKVVHDILHETTVGLVEPLVTFLGIFVGAAGIFHVLLKHFLEAFGCLVEGRWTISTDVNFAWHVAFGNWRGLGCILILLVGLILLDGLLSELSIVEVVGLSIVGGLLSRWSIVEVLFGLSIVGVVHSVVHDVHRVVVDIGK